MKCKDVSPVDVTLVLKQFAKQLELHSDLLINLEWDYGGPMSKHMKLRDDLKISTTVYEKSEAKYEGFAKRSSKLKGEAGGHLRNCLVIEIGIALKESKQETNMLTKRYKVKK